MTTASKLQALRQVMQEHHLSAVIIPSNDPHQSEYVAKRWSGREWISGFTGSAGTVVVTADHAGLWTDGRYYVQAEQELADTEYQLHKLTDMSYTEWLVSRLSVGSKVAIDGKVCSVLQLEHLEKKLSPAGLVVTTHIDPLGLCWGDQPALPEGPIFVHDTKYNGESRASKISRIWEKLNESGADCHLVSTLDDIAWILNIRGADVEFNPVAISYLIISLEKITLYINPAKVTAEVLAELVSDGVECKPYEDIVGDLHRLPEEKKILIDPASCSIVHYRSINCEKVRGKTISRHMKALKNQVEMKHGREVMVKDGVALAHTFYWLEQLHQNGQTCTEADFADKLAHHRSLQPHYVGESFPAIIGYNANGAIIHYRPMHGSAAELEPKGILLADSGGQYLDGTTDITRTIALGTPTAEQKRNFTLVLKGHIELARAQYPVGTRGGQLDALARMHLWSHGLNYGHGTGHGVGFFLNVHEPPQGIAPPPSERASTKLEPGMLTSNEPGYYKTGEYGIRIENLVYTVKAAVDGFCRFDTVTLYPIDLRLIDENLMSKSDKAWLNKYHHKVYQQLTPHLQGDIKTWFELKCRGMN